MTRLTTDICVIGAGSGGLSVAAGAVQMGARVVLIEAGEMGGDCLNTGCVPSKALLHAGAAGMGWEAAHEHMRAAMETIAPHDSVERFEGLGVTVIRGFARFTGPREVEVEGAQVRARRFVIATGSRPRLPDIPGLAEAPCLTNETIFDLAEKPDHLLILGGGPIGVEMAQAHRQLGCDVTVVEPARVLGREDPEASARVVAALKTAGVRIAEGVEPTRVRRQNGMIEIVTTGGETFSGSHLLVATGRVASVAGLGLEAAGVEVTPAGVKVDARMRTSNRRVYAIGDVAGGMQFTHLAGYHAGVILRAMLFGLPAKAATAHVPRVTYTTPELAQVGLTEAEARAAFGDRLEVLRAEFADNDRAIVSGQTAGFLKVMVHRGRPVGATLVGPDAGDQIALWALALAARLKIGAIAGMVLPYPTRSEISKRAAGAYFSPRLFDNPNVKRLVRVVQKLVP